MNCPIHEDRLATRALNVPCAPEGKLWVCDECHAEKNRKATFEAYFAAHSERVRRKRAEEQLRQAQDN